jgi:signal transduction histidine kinase/ActR/RegA family two-component response regulator
MPKSRNRFIEALLKILSFGRNAGSQSEPATVRPPVLTLDQVVGSLLMPLAVLDAEGAIVYYNPAWDEWTRECGLPRFASPGQKPNFADTWRLAQAQAIPEADVIIEGIAEVLSGARAQSNHEFSVQRPAGTRWLILEARRPQAGRGAVLSLHDASEMRRLEQNLRQTESQLRQSQKIEALGRLAGGVAHDFNNLITIITSCCDLLLHGRLGDQGARTLIAEIRKAAERASVLARRVVTSSRRQAPSSTVLDLNVLLTHVTRMMRGLISENIELITSLEHDVGKIRIDAAQIEQVIINLVLNARDAMPQGGKLTIATHNVHLDETHREQHPGIEPGPYVLLTVSDTGSGIPPEVMRHLFEPYFTTKEEGKGTGLGLSIARGIIRQHAGHLEVASAPGQGSTFLIYLPEVDAPIAPSEEQPAPEEPARGTETLLLVEDVSAVRMAVRQLLQLSGYHVIEAGSGMEAIDKMEAHVGRIDLLVSDLVLPQMSGPQIAEVLRLKNPRLHVLYISGYEEEDLLHGNVAQEQLDVLRKPFGPDELVRRVRHALDDPAASPPKGLALRSPHAQNFTNGSRVQEG